MTSVRLAFKRVNFMERPCEKRVSPYLSPKASISIPLGAFRCERKLLSGRDVEFFEGGMGGNFLHKKVSPINSLFCREA